MRAAHSPILSVLCLLLLSCASGHREPFSDDTAVVRELAEVERELRSCCNASPLLEVKQVGTIRYPGFEAPLWMVRYRPVGAGQRALITAGVHGNEPAGCAWVVELVGRIAEQETLFRHIELDLVPLVNPWGWSRDIRFNRDGRDINRDFASFDTQEARIFADAIASADYDLVIDHHEDPDADGFYIYQYAKRDTSLSRQVIAEIRALGYSIEQDVRMVILRTRDGVIDAPRWGLRYMRLSRQLSISNYLRLEYCPEVYTIETPTHLPMEDRLHMHRVGFETLVQGVLGL